MDVIPESQLLPGLIQRPPELGRIRLGEKTDGGTPKRLTTFRLTSASKATLEAAALLYGGKVRAWTGAPDEGMWELITQVAEIDVLIPGQLAVISQSYELWQGGTCERRCDGTTEAISASPCICAANGLTGADRECDIVTRLRVMLPRVPGLGVWRLDTSGYQAATTLPSTVQLLARLTPGQWIPAVLRAEQRSKRERLENGKVETHRFVVPVLDLPGATIGQIVQLAAPAEAPRLLNGGEKPTPPTAKERVAQRRAELEAGNAISAEGCPVASPRGATCVLQAGHLGDHRQGNVSWPTPNGIKPVPEERAETVIEATQADELAAVPSTDQPIPESAPKAVSPDEPLPTPTKATGTTPPTERQDASELIEQCESISKLSDGRCERELGHGNLHRTSNEAWTVAGSK